MASITCYDGVGTIGGNKILLEDGDARLWLDFGLSFGQMGRFYEEYLKPKPCAGIYEPVRMGLIPPIRDLYRQDQVCSLADPWDGIESKEIGPVAGILLSHAHQDHVGALPHVRTDIPVYCTPMSLAIMQATQDVGVGGAVQFCDVKSPKARETGELTFTGASGPVLRRDFLGLHDGAQPVECGGLKVRRFPVDHSIYGACAWVIETGAGAVVYTGDLRCHGRRGALTMDFAEEVAKLSPRALIMEGTRIESESKTTEEEVRDRALDEVRKAKGLVIADFGPRNIERLVSFLEIAKATGRKLVLLPKDAYLLLAMRIADPSVPDIEDPAILIYAEYEGSTAAWKKSLKERYASKFMSPQDISRRQGEMICCFSFFDVNELVYIRPAPGSIWIYSSCEAFNEEMRIDFDRLRNWLAEYGVCPLGVPDRGKPEEKNPFHVSGHASRADLLRLIEIIRPQTLIPVHTEKPDVYKEAVGDLCEVILPKKAMPIRL